MAPRLKRTGLRAESAHPNQRVLFRLHLHTSAEFSICIRRSPRMMKAQSENDNAQSENEKKKKYISSHVFFFLHFLHCQKSELAPQKHKMVHNLLDHYDTPNHMGHSTFYPIRRIVKWRGIFPSVAGDEVCLVLYSLFPLLFMKNKSVIQLII